MSSAQQPMRAYLVRHGSSEPDHPQGDRHRSLTAEGKAEFERHVDRLVPGLYLTRVVCSPFMRARQTADILGGALRVPVEVDDSLASGQCSGVDVLLMLRRFGDGVALVGHNPEMGEAISRAAGRGQPVLPGTVAEIQLSMEGPTLCWLRSPLG